MDRYQRERARHYETRSVLKGLLDTLSLYLGGIASPSPDPDMKALLADAMDAAAQRAWTDTRLHVIVCPRDADPVLLREGDSYESLSINAGEPRNGRYAVTVESRRGERWHFPVADVKRKRGPRALLYVVRDREEVAA